MLLLLSLGVSVVLCKRTEIEMRSLISAEEMLEKSGLKRECDNVEEPLSKSLKSKDNKVSPVGGRVFLRCGDSQKGKKK